MTAIDIAAIVGAAAWLPQIGTWIYRAVVTPRLEFVPAPAPELGFTSLGPILNIRAALSCGRKDAIVENMRIVLRHERGREIELTWASLNETISQIRGAGGETTDVSKWQPAIALKLSTLTLVEKLIGFQDTRFHSDERALVLAVVEHHNHLKKTRADFADETLRSKQFADLIDFHRRSMCWEVGRYNMTAFIHVIGMKRPTTRKWQFSLVGADIERLQQNVEEVARYSRETIVPPPLDARRDYLWNWINPALESIP